MKPVHKIMIAGGAALLIAIAILVITLYAPEKDIPEDYSNMTLAQAYPKVEAAGRPAIIVFSRYTECCLELMNYYGVYNYYAKGILEDYKDRMAAIFIDHSALDDESRAVAQELAERYGVTAFPTLIVLDGEGKLLEKFEGDMQEDKIREALDGIAGVA
jgi:thioredoxin-related protein